MAKKKVARIEIVTTPELKEQVKAAADKAHQSLNYYAETAFREKLRKEENSQEDDWLNS